MDNGTEANRRPLPFPTDRSGHGDYWVILPPIAGSREEATEIAMTNGWPGVFAVTNGKLERELRLLLWREM